MSEIQQLNNEDKIDKFLNDKLSEEEFMEFEEEIIDNDEIKNSLEDEILFRAFAEYNLSKSSDQIYTEKEEITPIQSIPKEIPQPTPTTLTNPPAVNEVADETEKLTSSLLKSNLAHKTPVFFTVLKAAFFGGVMFFLGLLVNKYTNTPSASIAHKSIIPAPYTDSVRHIDGQHNTNSPVVENKPPQSPPLKTDNHKPIKPANSQSPIPTPVAANSALTMLEPKAYVPGHKDPKKLSEVLPDSNATKKDYARIASTSFDDAVKSGSSKSLADSTRLMNYFLLYKGIANYNLKHWQSSIDTLNKINTTMKADPDLYYNQQFYKILSLEKLNKMNEAKETFHDLFEDYPNKEELKEVNKLLEKKPL